MTTTTPAIGFYSRSLLYLCTLLLWMLSGCVLESAAAETVDSQQLVDSQESVAAGRDLFASASPQLASSHDAATWASDEPVLSFVPRRASWNSVSFGEVPLGSEFIHGSRLYRLRDDGSAIVGVEKVRLGSLVDADSTWNPAAKHRAPRADDVVWVTSQGGRHDLLRGVADGEEFAFQGRLFTASLDGDELTIQPTGVTLNRVVQTFERTTATLVDLSIEHGDIGEHSVITGTPEHPFFVPATNAYVAMGDLEPGTILLTDDGTVAVVSASATRETDAEVFNFEVEHAHNYFVAGPGAIGPGVLVHNRCWLGQVLDNPSSIWGMSADDIAEHLVADGYVVISKPSTTGSGLATIVEPLGHPTLRMIQVSPGGGRHVGAYYKISDSVAGNVRVVDDSFVHADDMRGTIVRVSQ